MPFDSEDHIAQSEAQSLAVNSQRASTGALEPSLYDDLSSIQGPCRTGPLQ